MDPELETKIKQWMSLEKHRIHYLRELEKIRNDQNRLEGNIMHSIPVNTRSQWKITPSSGGTIRFQQNRNYTKISHKFLKQALDEYEGQHKTWSAKNVFSFIVSSRPFTESWAMSWKRDT